MSRLRLERAGFALTLLAALLLMLLPLPGLLAPLKPYWPALALIYWTLEAEDRVSLGLAFALGLGADLLSGVALGEQALRLVALVFIVQHFRSRLRFFPMWQQALAVFVLLLNDRVLLLLIRLLAGGSMPPLDWWASPFTGAALWPFLFLLLDDLRVRLRIQ